MTAGVDVTAAGDVMAAAGVRTSVATDGMVVAGTAVARRGRQVECAKHGQAVPGGAATDGSAGQRAIRLGGLRRALGDVGVFGEVVLRMPLRPYQLDIARAVHRSVANGQGLTFTVLMPRQAGKNQPSVGHLHACSDTSRRARSSREPPASAGLAHPRVPAHVRAGVTAA